MPLLTSVFTFVHVEFEVLVGIFTKDIFGFGIHERGRSCREISEKCLTNRKRCFKDQQFRKDKNKRM